MELNKKERVKIPKIKKYSSVGQWNLDGLKTCVMYTKSCPNTS